MDGSGFIHRIIQFPMGSDNVCHIISVGLYIARSLALTAQLAIGLFIWRNMKALLKSKLYIFMSVFSTRVILGQVIIIFEKLSRACF